ncbi:MAG TPA: hypothetical protein GXZ60_06635 [Intrasporangiaceae bacterium]|nr:hypothetical protein [Intrasporangiaceae bacterium]
MTDAVRRVIAGLVLILTGILSLPLAAAVLDGRATENLIIPAQLICMAFFGAGLAIALPSLAPAAAEPKQRALVGAGWGVLAALVGLLVFWLALNGFDGA